MNESYDKHYITVDNGRITDGFSSAFRQPQGSDICINEHGGYQFRLFPDGEENPPLTDMLTGCRLYRYDNGQVRKATDAELAAELAEIEANKPPAPPTVEQQLTEVKTQLAQSDAAALELYELVISLTEGGV